jgi:hypothetical protein
MFAAEKLSSGLIKTHGKSPVSTGGGRWCPQACRFLNIRHHPHSAFEKGIVEGTMQHIKDRTDNLMTIFHVKRRGVNQSM